MQGIREPWTVVLAAGEGSRLRSLTTDSEGKSIPKQFCSLNGGPSLLQLALRRASRVSPWSQITTIVAEQHEDWWSRELGFVRFGNVVVQPANRGTAIGVLLPVLRILARDPAADVVLLPSDHYFTDEPVLERALRGALREVDRRPDRLVLLGIVPDEPDTGFGWIVPADNDRPGIRRVQRFVEKPPATVAVELMARGGVWNSFVLAATGRTIVRSFEEKLPGVVTTLKEALARDSGLGSVTGALARTYEELGTFDFCRDVLEGLEDRLSVLPVPNCGWSDLGTPDRVARCIDRIPDAPRSVSHVDSRLDLAQASLALQASATP
jgi:mannose-1-phosphate guanylyltransferase